MSPPKQSCAKLTIHFDHKDGVYRAQRWLKGHVKVEGLADNQELQEPIKVKLVGKETTWGTNSFSSVGETSEEESILWNTEVILPLLSSSSHQYPFSIFLPGSLAPSMYFEDLRRRHGGCSVGYELFATSTGLLSAHKFFRIVGAPCSKPHPLEIGPKALAVGTSGSLTLGVHLSNSHVAKGANLAVGLAIYNASTTELRQVNLQLVEKVEWRNHTETHVLEEALNVDSPSMHMDTCTGEVSDDAIHSKLARRENEICVPVPVRSRDSYDGSGMIEIHHWFNIAIVTQTGKVLEETIPVRIYDPPVLAQHRHQAVPKKKVVDLATTIWPNEPNPSEIVQSLSSSLHSSDCTHPRSLVEQPIAE